MADGGATVPALAEALVPVFATLMGPECAAKVLLAGDYLNGPCLKMALSKALGFAIILGAIVVKFPQIYKFVKAKSAQGVSLVAQLQELFTYTVTLAYNIVKGFPFSTWGESLFITIQLVVLNGLILFYNKKTSMLPVLVIVWAAFFGWLVTGMAGPLLTTLQVAGIPILALSRIIQIWTTFSNGSTGELSFITSLMNLAGVAARVFTTLQEVDDPIILVSFLSGFVFNLIIILQFAWYWNAKPTKAGKGEKKSETSATSASADSAKSTPQRKQAKKMD
eukprot:m.66742 g.66742  ORF g.66742 m.66742 type:complete len:279 (+) comp14064_c0_seq1:132-968(+)